MASGTRVTRSQMVVGTLGYMAPEQHGDPRKVDGRCDIYALGAILFEYATGRPYSQVQLPPALVRPGFPPRLARIVMQCLAPDPAKRIGSMPALAAEIEDWLETAEAAGWGEEPLPGFGPASQEMATVSCARDRPGPSQEEPEARLGAYLDALRTGGVGSRRSAKDGLLNSVLAGDEPFLLAELGQASEGMRFALVTALGQVGSSAALPALLTLLNGGVGNLVGYLGSGWWFHACTRQTATHWPQFWWGLSATVAAVLAYFLWAFRDQRAKARRVMHAAKP